MSRSSISNEDVFPAELAVDADVRLGLTSLLPPGPVFVTSVDNDTWAERNGLSKGAEIVALGPKQVRVSGLTAEAFLEAVRDRPLYVDIRLSDSKSVEELDSLLAQGFKDIRWPPARPNGPFILGDGLDLNASTDPVKTDLELALPSNSTRQRPNVERQSLDSPTSKPETSIESIEDALRAAHQHALAEAKRYWRCEMAISETRMRCYMTRVEASEMREQLVSEPREAAAELRQASEMREEALVVARQVGDSEMKLAELHFEIASKSSDARHVARHYTHKQQSIDDAREMTLKHSNMAQSDRRIADLHQQEALLQCRKAEPVFDMLSHVETEAQQMRHLLKTEQAECDKQQQLRERLRREIRDLRNHGPSEIGQVAKNERNVLLRELRELNKLTRDRPNNTLNSTMPLASSEEARRSSTLRPSTPPPLVKRSTLAATLAARGENFDRSGYSDFASQSGLDSPQSSHATLSMSPSRGFEGSEVASRRTVPMGSDSGYSETPSEIEAKRRTLQSSCGDFY